MERIFNYRPDGNTITTNAGDKKLMVIRKGPRGIVALIKSEGPVVIWSGEDADAHASDSESELIQKIIDVLNA
jgi:hypothetical protein